MHSDLWIFFKFWWFFATKITNLVNFWPFFCLIWQKWWFFRLKIIKISKKFVEHFRLPQCLLNAILCGAIWQVKVINGCVAGWLLSFVLSSINPCVLCRRMGVLHYDPRLVKNQIGVINPIFGYAYYLWKSGRVASFLHFKHGRGIRYITEIKIPYFKTDQKS